MLRDLNLKPQSAAALPSDFGWVTGLTRLDLSGNAYGGASGTLPVFWSNLAALTYLDLSRNIDIYSSVPAQWAMGMTAMKTTPGAGIILSDLFICGTLPAGLNITQNSDVLGQAC